MTATRPLILLTVALDTSAPPATITLNHGDAYERAMRATAGQDIAGLELVELPVPAPVFKALRGPLKIPDDCVGLYDVFPINPSLDSSLRDLAGQFLAAEALWTLDEQGLLGSVPVNLKLSVPKNWSSDPKEIHKGLVDAGALALAESALTTYKTIKAAWDSTTT